MEQGYRNFAIGSNFTAAIQKSASPVVCAELTHGVSWLFRLAEALSGRLISLRPGRLTKSEPKAAARWYDRCPPQRHTR
jgi:hypothetical protein